MANLPVSSNVLSSVYLLNFCVLKSGHLGIFFVKCSFIVMTTQHIPMLENLLFERSNVDDDKL